MDYTYTPQGVCSQVMRFELKDDGIVHNVEIGGGCNGNGQGLAALVEGMQVEEVVRRLKGIHCGWKNTSCPDQLACALEVAWKQQNSQS